MVLNMSEQRYWGIWHIRAASFFVDGDGRLIYYPSKAVADQARLRMCYPERGSHELDEIEVREFVEDDAA